MNIEFINKLENGPTLSVLKDLINSNTRRLTAAKYNFDRYKGTVVPIYSSQPVRIENFETGGNNYRVDDKVVNQIANTFDSDVVDTKIGYLFGNPIVYDYDEENEEVIESIKMFNLRNRVDDLDAELGKNATISGYAARLCYIDKDGKERIKNIPPWEAIFVGDDISEPTYAVRYIKVGNTEFIEFYDDRHVYFYKDNHQLEVKEHMFDYCPLFGVKNNEELQGDNEKIYGLIDGYDKILSSAVSEIEASRLAYLVLQGMGIDEDMLSQMKKSGIAQLIDEKMDMKYLTKDVNDTMIMNVLKTIEENISKFAKTVNFNDESFGGNLSGVAIRYKLMALENKCAIAERKFTSALSYQFKVLFSSWRKRGISLSDDDYLKVYYVFTRNIPINKLEEAQILTSLKGFVSEETRLSQSSLVDDVDFELENMEIDTTKLSEELGYEHSGTRTEDSGINSSDKRNAR